MSEISFNILEWIQNQGFSIAIAVYLLYERSKYIKNNTEVLHSLKLAIEKLCLKLP
jgi:hypothetical protein